MHFIDESYQAQLSARFDAVLVNGAGEEDRGGSGPATAVALAGGRVVTSASFAEAVTRIAGIASRPLILIDARMVSEDELARSLSRLDGLAAGRDLPVVVAIASAQIDVTAAGLMMSRHQILCDPAPSDWAAAIAVAQGTADLTLHDRISENEAARLARLNAEVARIADVLARLSKHEEPTRREIVADAGLDFASEPGGEHPITAADIRQIVRARRLRDRYVGSGLFEDPAWDMMLDLYAAHLERAHVSVSSLCIAAAVAPTTALRWIARLTEAGLFERRPDPFDRRRAFMSLTERGLDAMRRYVSMARTLGLPVV